MMRKSKRELRTAIEDLTDGSRHGYRRMDLAQLVAHDWETVDGNQNLCKQADTGQIYYFPPQLQEKLADLFDL